MFFVYAVKSLKVSRIYVGMTQDIEKRIAEHNSGKTKSTKGYLPWELFYYEIIDSRQNARNREKKLKQGSGKEYLKNILSRNTYAQKKEIKDTF